MLCLLLLSVLYGMGNLYMSRPELVSPSSPRCHRLSHPPASPDLTL